MLKFLKYADYLKIIEIGLTNIRDQAFSNDIQGCIIEADHIHNIPQFLQNLNEGAEAYYWNVERESYIRKARKERSATYEPIWARYKGVV